MNPFTFGVTIGENPPNDESGDRSFVIILADHREANCTAARYWIGPSGELNLIDSVEKNILTIAAGSWLSVYEPTLGGKPACMFFLPTIDELADK